METTMPHIMKNKFLPLSILFALILPLTLALPGNVWSADLHASKQAGLIGEKTNGYLGLVKSAPADVSKLVADINKKRNSLYRSIATKNGASLLQIELLAGKKAIQKTPSGYYIQLPSGAWAKKP